MPEQVVVASSSMSAAGGDGGTVVEDQEAGNGSGSDKGDEDDEEERPICSLNIGGDEMILFPSSVIVDDDTDSNALEMILANDNNERSEFKWKFICCLYGLISLTCTLSDVALTSYMCLKKAHVLVAEFHTLWDFEGPLLVAQALLAVTFSTFATQVVIRGMRISTRVYFSCLAGLVLVISVIFGWIFKEDTHGHELKDMSLALKYLRRRIQRYIRFQQPPQQQLPPAWLEDFQRESRCCGLEDIYDWKSLWGKPDVPDSCCTYDGCGKNFFLHNRTVAAPEGVYLTGCIHSKETFTPTHLMALEQIKFIQAFFMIFITLVWLCCWDKFISRPDQEILLRYVPPSNEQRVESMSERPRYDEDCNEPQGVTETLQLRTVESRDSRQGAGDLGRKSEDTLRPKTQDNYQSGDYTDIDPTKATTTTQIIVDT